MLCIPESFNKLVFIKYLSPVFVHYKIIFVNSQHTPTNSKGYLYSKKKLLNASFKDF